MAHTIEIISIGSDLYSEVEPVIERLNASQSEFKFVIPPARLRDNGLPFRQKDYHTNEVFGFLRRYRLDAKGHRPFLIAIVNTALRSDVLKNLFGSHEATEGLAVTTLADHLRFAQSTDAYLCYYFIRYSLSFVAPSLKTHDETRSCFFDKKIFKPDLTKSMLSGDLCDACLKALQAQFNPEIYEAIHRMIATLHNILRTNLEGKAMNECTNEVMDSQGLSKIAGCDNSDRRADIVFVHGLGGGSHSTWRADGKDAHFWPKSIAAEFSETGVWTFGYAAAASTWKAESMPISDRGNNFLEQLYSDGIGTRPLIFITHSMGGIVVKQILRHADSFAVNRWEAISKNTKGIAFIATPHSGANIASFAEFARAVLRTNEHVSELAAHHPRLRELHGWFLAFCAKQKLVCRSYGEKREVKPEIPFLGLKLPKGIIVVDESSAEPNIQGERAIPLDEDHISICKPSHANAEICKSIRMWLRECLTQRPRLDYR
jgi:pimeloyl-ACP methyl ester carboxylesterase